MKIFTLKTFLKDFLFNWIGFVALSLVYYVLLTYPRTFRLSAITEMFRAWPIFLYGITYCILFYFLFFKKILMHVKGLTVLINLAALITGFYLCDIIYLQVLGLTRNFQRPITWLEPSVFFRLGMFTGYAILYSFVKAIYWLRIKKLKTEQENTAALLQNLKARIEPHFVFNSLNIVFALAIEEKAEKTAACLEELSGLFRYSLRDKSQAEVPVQEELEFIERYIHLNKMRLDESDSVKVNSTIVWDKSPANIAPMLIVTFLENAFKHGISFKGSSHINIRLYITNGVLKLLVQNSIHVKEETSVKGFGLQNTRQRLKLLYEDNYLLREQQIDGVYIVNLTINLHQI